MQNKLIIFSFVFLIGWCNSFPQSPYKSKHALDIALLSAGTVISILDLTLIDNKQPLTIQELELINSDNINSFDKSAINNFSETSSFLSDILLISSSLPPLFLFASSKIRNDAGTVSTMYLQVAFYSYAIPHLSKGTFDRYRPYVYNSEVPLDKKLSTESKLSFFSGHATFAFANAVFSSKVYCDYYPESDWSTVIWSANILLASAVSYFRYSSGSHFFTDILTGALVGSLIGYLIPVIHKNEISNSQLIAPQPNKNLFTIRLNLN